MDVYEYTKRIQECTKTGNMSGAIHLFNVMKEEGVKPDVIIYNVMMDGFSKANNADKVTQLFDEMLRIGIKPNLYVFNTAIRACAIDVDLKRAAQLFSTMQQQYALKPESRTYNALLHICAVARQLPLAKKCFAKMEKEGVPRDVITYNSLIDAYAEATDKAKGQQHLKECRLLLERMKTEQIIMNDRTYNALIKVCIRGELLKEALNFVTEIKKAGMKLSVFIFSPLFDGLAKISSISNEDAKATMDQLLDEMSARLLKPSLVSYTSLLNLCCRLEDLERAKDFFRQLKKSGLKPNAICYGTMIKCYEKLGDASNKEEYLKPAFDLFEEMQARGISIERESATSLISACGNARDISRAVQVWTLIKRHGIVPDAPLFRAMIKASLRTNELQGAFQYLRQMESAGVIRNQTVCCMFLRFFAAKSMKKNAQQFLKEMVALKVRQNDGISEALKSLGLAGIKESCRSWVPSNKRGI